MPGTAPSKAVEDVWIAMSEHFLDTEVRHNAPRTAATCLEAGLSISGAHGIWRRDLVPLLTPNLLSVAGEWAAFDDTWLVEELQRRARRGRGLLGWWNRTTYHRLMRAAWQSIERAMQDLERVPTERRGERVRTLESLCRTALDFARDPQPSSEEERLALAPVALSILAPTLSAEETAAAAERLGLRSP